MSDAGAQELSPAYVAARRRRLHQVLIFALCLMSLLAYANSFRCGFTLDSRPLILDDTRVKAVNPTNLGLIFKRHYWARLESSGLYRPVTTLSFLFNYAVLRNGAKPAGYHAVNLALQFLNVALVYLLAWRLFGDFALAFATAALWTVHPLLTESVTNIVGRADMLAGAAVLGGLLCHIRGAEATDEEARARWAIGLAALATIGLFAKESVVVLPALMVAYDFTFRRKHAWRSCRLGYLALILPLAFWWWVRSRVLIPPLHPAVDNPLLMASGFWTAELTAVKVIGRYMWLLVFPLHLSSDYSYNQIPLVSLRFNHWEDWQAVLALALCALLLVAALVCYRRSKPLFFWIAFSVITFVPTSNLIVLIGSIMALRFMYLPAIGFAACLAAALVAAGRRLRIPALAPVTIGLLTIAFGCRTFARNFDWRTDETLALSAVADSPNSFKTHRAMGAALAVRKPPELEQAARETERSMDLLRDLPAWERIASVYSAAGEYYRQIGEAKDAAGADPSVSLAWYRKSLDVLLQGVAIDHSWNARFKEQHLRGGIKLSRIPDTGMPQVYMDLGTTYLRLKEPQLALEALQYGRKLDLYNIEFYGLMGAAYAAMNQFDQQAIVLLEAVTLAPKDLRLTHALRTVYTRVDTGGCPAGTWDAASERLHLNLSCRLIEQHVCTARENLVRLMMEAKQEETADRLRNDQPLELHCAAAKP